jgi:hypothetical protein
MRDLLWVILIYCSVSLALFVALLVVLLWLFRKLVRSQLWRQGWFGSGMANSLLGLGVAALLEPTLLPTMIGLVINVFYQLLFEIPLGVFEGLRVVLERCSGDERVLEPGSECLRTTFGNITQAWGKAGFNLLEDFQQFPYPALVIFLIAWGLAAFLFSYLRQPDKSDTSPRWKSWLETVHAFLRSQTGRVFTRNMLFFAIILIGGYLSLASIAAIPILQQNPQPDETLSADTLAQQLQVAHSQIEQNFSEAQQATDPFISLKDWIDVETAQIDSYARRLDAGETITLTTNLALDDNILFNMQGRLEDVQDKLSDYEKSLTQIQSDWEIMRDSAITNLVQAKDEAVRSYRFSEQSRVGVYENTEHYFQLANWYNRESSTIRIKLEKCQNEFDRVNLALRSWSDDLSNTLANTPNPDVNLNLNVNLPGSFGFDSCRERVEIQTPMPARQSLGALYLGPFGLVASWLLQTESFPLALITGMLGFGLLGAAASTVIREEDETKSLVSNLSGVVIRGTLAAVVVFLAVEGGLAVFTQGDADPNPYVLLFTCLVGAVYSEVIWERAKEYLTEQVTKRRSQKDIGKPEDENYASGGSDADDDGVSGSSQPDK